MKEAKNGETSYKNWFLAGFWSNKTRKKLFRIYSSVHIIHGIGETTRELLTQSESYLKI